MYERKIRALKDFELTTIVDAKFFVKGEVATVKFKNRNEYLNLLEYKNFVEARPDEAEGKVIPVVENEDYLMIDKAGDKTISVVEKEDNLIADVDTVDASAVSDEEDECDD